MKNSIQHIKLVNICILSILVFCFLNEFASAQNISGSNSENIDIIPTGEWVRSLITISGAPSGAVVSSMDVHFSAVHPYAGDLDIDLNDEGITRNYDLWANEGGSSVNPSRTVYGITTFKGLPVNGDWYLYAVDTWTQDDGYIDEWWITIHYSTYTVYGIVSDFAGGTDADSDGYYETFNFNLGVDGNAVPDSADVYAKMICNTTGQEWWSPDSFVISGSATDYHYYPFDETNFAGRINGNTDLDFTVEIWDSTKTTMLATDTSVTGEPVKADSTLPLSTTRVHGTMQYLDVNGNPHPIRYAKVDVIDKAPDFDYVDTTNTDENGNYAITINNSDFDGSGADIVVRVYTEGVSGAYPGATSNIASIKDDVFNLTWFLESNEYTNNTQSDLSIDLTGSNTCGDCGAFAVYDSIVEAFHKTLTIYSYEMSGITTWWPASGTYYSPSSSQISFVQGDRWDRDVILHEYGHYIQDVLNFQDGDVSDNSHSWDEDLRYSAAGSPVTRTDEQARNLALREAWPTFFSISVQYDDTADSVYNDTDDQWISHDLEDDTALHGSPGQFNESMTVCLLWDIFDNQNGAMDDDDTLSLGHGEIWTVVGTDKPDEITGFWNSWFVRYNYAREITRVFLDHRMTFIAQSPTGPTPANGSSNQLVTVDLNWNIASNATSYDVYFGTDPTPDSGEYQGNTSPNFLTLGTLSYGTTYYWQIIAKDGNAEAEGSVWSFTTQASPGILSVTPPDGLTSSGTQGGPFSPSNKTYTLINTGSSSISWTMSKGQSWVTLSSAGGTLASGTSTIVTVSINSNANSLAPSTYSDTVSFTNTTNSNGNTTRPVSLVVNTTDEITCNPYDTNCDWTCGDFELLDAIDAWAIGILGDFELLDLIDFWAYGSYCWDNVAGSHKTGIPDATGACQ